MQGDNTNKMLGKVRPNQDRKNTSSKSQQHKSKAKAKKPVN
jgi:hypothetical protein